ncbi:hypothetical protein [Paenibacillus sp. GP183]|uniref:hypothetical protein n=1 Tax=Paenibacillus sp. GP183 TaxID=1882751 RepID=UPI0008978B26|nr:hypothetical protein [Paenibacillus sp. GP183]SEC18594.1 hypothetical protein SAMN05443246_3264 [Paenibacillus sp. GP183]
MINSYPFIIYSGILDPKHYQNLGPAIWFFLWCVSSTTKEVKKDGVIWGIVLGNKPMNLVELSAPFGVSSETVRRWIGTLKQHDYIKVTRAPYGLIIHVKNSKKFSKRTGNFVDTVEGDSTDLCSLPNKSVGSNKDITKIITATAYTDPAHPEFIGMHDTNRSVKLVENAYCELHNKPSFNLTPTDTECMYSMLNKEIPVPFIIDNMRRIYAVRNKKTKVNSFSYYEQPIYDAWENELFKSMPLGAMEPSKGELLTEGPKRRAGKTQHPQSRYQLTNAFLQKAWEDEQQREQRTIDQAILDDE